MLKTEVAKSPGMNADRLGMPGWQTLARTVRALDEDRIKSTKDDIDTLLVFAGLFSAVLSALLVQSYLSLQPDRAAETVMLLHRITNQNYTVNAGHLNVTSPIPAADPSFRAPAYALQVNGLWFASLILSLAASSLGMLVKSWLREYLAGDWTSPQMQLRARQYRHPSLADWKVFEIAAALPLLIQLSLGLFFTGLCVFTKSVDEHMFWTCVPLVGAWALFFLVTTILPLVFPKCPYKIFLIRRLLTMLRNISFAGIMFAARNLPPVLPLYGHVSSRWLTKLEHTSRPDSTSGVEREEENAVFTTANDKTILMNIDETMMDDGEIGEICEAYRSSRPNPAEVISFILELIHRRVGCPGDEMPSSPLTSILDLSKLSLAAYRAIMTTVSDVIYNNSAVLRDDSPAWLYDAVILLLSNSPHPLPREACVSLDDVLSDAGPQSLGGKTLGKRLSTQAIKSQPFTPLSKQLAFLCHSRGKVLIATPLHIYNKLLGVFVDAGPTLLETLWAHPDVVDNMAARPIIDDIWDFVNRILLMRMSVMEYRKGMLYCLMFLLQFAPKLGKEQQAMEMLSEYWSTQSQTFRLLMLCTAVNPQARLPDSIVYPVMEKTSLNAEPEDQPILISTTSAILQIYLDDQMGPASAFEPLDYVRFCHMFLRLYAAFVRHCVQSQSPDYNGASRDAEGCSNAIKAAYMTLWGKLGKAVKKYFAGKSWTWERRISYWRVSLQPFTTAQETLDEDRDMAAECLRLIAELDTPETRSLAALPTSTPSSSLFPDVLISSLKLFAESSDNPSLTPSSKSQPMSSST